MIPTSGTKCLLDTNILIAYFNAGSPKHSRAREFLERISGGDVLGFISSQNILELSSVLANTYHVPSLSIANNISDLARELSVIYPNPKTIEIFTTYLRSKNMHAMDLFLLATAKAHELDYFVTEDKHFKSVTEIKVYNPFLTG